MPTRVTSNGLQNVSPGRQPPNQGGHRRQEVERDANQNLSRRNAGRNNGRRLSRRRPGLSSELVRKILMHVCDTNQDPTAQYPNPRTYPLLLCQVCSLWRDIVINTPDFWAKIAIVNHRPAPELLKLWIERSGNCYFAFSWDFTKRDNETSSGESRDEYKGRVLPLLWDIMHRWQTVIISENHPPTTFAEQNFPLDVQRCMVKNAVLTQRLSPPPQRSTNWLIWSSTSFPIPCGNFPFWGALGCIKIKNPLSLYECINTLPYCLGAVSIELGCVTPNNEYARAPTQIRQNTLPQLSTLVLRTAGFDITHLLAYFNCPRLRYLCYGTHGLDDSTFTRFASFIQRSSCVLEKLMISDYSLDVHGVAQYFSTSVFVDNVVDEFVLFPGPTSTSEKRNIRSLMRAALSSSDNEMVKISRSRDIYSYGWLKLVMYS